MMTGGLLLWLGSTTSPCGDAPAPFSSFMATDEVEEAWPDLGWTRDMVKRRGDGIFQALWFERQRLKMGVARGPIYRAKELKISRVSRILSLDELVADSVEI
jgi:hypothetical protein